MNMNTTPAELESGAVVAPPKASKAKRPEWIEKGFAEAEAHNTRPLRPIQIFAPAPETIGSSAKEVKLAMQDLPTRIALGGCYLVFWGTAAAVAFGLFL
ncbi:MAG: hypothetical protein AAFP23_03570 [Pseudomonadota bacterium]